MGRKSRAVRGDTDVNTYSRKFREDYGREWDRAVDRLKRSGRNLDIPVKPEQEKYRPPESVR